MFLQAFPAVRHALSTLPPLNALSNGLWLHVTRGLRRGVALRRRELEQPVDDALLPKVALVGRPNVGKSALFNRLLRRRAALVYDTPNSHVTRDYQEGRAQLGDLVFRAADTSGLEPRTAKSGGTIQGRATALTAKLLRQSHLTLMVIDAKAGVLPADEELAEWLRRVVPPDQVLLVANKAEGAKAREEMPQTVYDSYRLGFGEPVAVSATTGEGMTDVYAALQPHIDRVAQQLQAAAGGGGDGGGAGWREEAAHRGASAGAPGGGRAEEAGVRRRTPLFSREGEEAAAGVGAERGDGEVPAAVERRHAGAGIARSAAGVLKLAIMGLPNAGKSTLLNALVGEERALTGPEPGLTRDAVRAAWTYGGQPVELIDTAGWVGRGLTGSYDDVGGDLAAMYRRATLTSLAGVHVALLVVDAEKALRNERVLSRREVALAHMVLREGKALVLVANKADLLNQTQRVTYLKALRRQLSERFLEAGQLPIVEVSARQGTGLGQVMPAVVTSFEAWNKRVPTSRLVRFVRKLSVRMVGSGMEGSLARIKFLAQLKARPPTFAAFVSGSRQRPMDRSVGSFLAHQIREVMGFQGVPVRLVLRYREDRRLSLRATARAAAAATTTTTAAASNSSSTRRGAKALAGQDGGEASDDDDGREWGRGDIMADALRRAEELRRDGAGELEQEGDGDWEEEGSKGLRPAARTRRSGDGDLMGDDNVEGGRGSGQVLRRRVRRAGLRRQARTADFDEGEADLDVWEPDEGGAGSGKERDGTGCSVTSGGRPHSGGRLDEGLGGSRAGDSEAGQRGAEAPQQEAGVTATGSQAGAAEDTRPHGSTEAGDVQADGDAGWRWEDARVGASGRRQGAAHGGGGAAAERPGSVLGGGVGLEDRQRQQHRQEQVRNEDRDLFNAGAEIQEDAGADERTCTHLAAGPRATTAAAVATTAAMAVAAARTATTSPGSSAVSGAHPHWPASGARKSTTSGGAGSSTKGTKGGPGAGVVSGSEAGISSKRSLLVRAMLLSRKPSAPLVPVRPPPGGKKKARGSAGRPASGGGER